jgi:hypothetical protein
MKLSATLRSAAGALILPTVALLPLMATSEAALVTWSAPTNISGAADVSTTGTVVGAFNLGDTGVPSATVNGVLFQSFAVPSFSAGATVGNFALTTGTVILSSNSFFGDPGNAPFNTLPPGYQTLLSSGVATIDNMTLTMSGLSIGTQYQFQWWTNASTAVDNVPDTSAVAGNTVTLNSNVTATPGGLGQYALGTFTADATSQAVRFDRLDPGEGGIGLVNAFQLRQVPPAVPEPGTALAGVALLGLCGMRRRCR